MEESNGKPSMNIYDKSTSCDIKVNPETMQSDLPNEY